MAPFAPQYRGGQSAASLIVALAGGKPYDTTLSFEEIAEQLEVGADDLVRIRSGIARAKLRLLRDHMRALEAVPGKGYRIIRPGEHARLATHHRRKSDRQVKRAIATIQGANENDMTDVERERNRKVGMALSLLYERQADVENRVARLEDLMLGKHKPQTIRGEVVEPTAIEPPAGEGPGDEEG